MAPPASGPTMLARAQVDANTPSQRPRSRGLKMSPTMVKAMALIRPPPRPWIAR